MTSITIISILNLIGFITSSYLETEAFMKPKLEKNNIVNKGVWIRKSGDDQPMKTVSGDFIFRASSLDADSLLQNNFDVFGENFMQESPLIPSYIERSKREAHDNQFSRENMQNVIDFPTINLNDEKAAYMSSKLITNLNSETVSNDYPYEVAIMLGNNNKREMMSSKSISIKDAYDHNKLNNSKKTPGIVLNIDNVAQKAEGQTLKKENGNKTNHNSTNIVPKRSMQHNYESEIIKKIEFTEEVNKTEDSYDATKIDRTVFDGDDRAWHQTAPVPDVNKFKILPKSEENKNKNKPITEKGLIKVLSMLTKTFKKVMKQHNDIKRIHTKLTTINDEFMKNAHLLMTKFQDFDVKYLYLMKFNENLKDLEAKLRNKEEVFNNKELELSKNLAEFENQQKKFLIQQRQFYNIQKLMLAQNEKINLKQNLIVKTQNEISLRQNNFARILKKAKQIYVDAKNPIPQKLSAILSKSKENTETKTNEIDKTTSTTSTQIPNTESIKINLFSVPSISRIVNYDKQLLNEKDDHSVDDLIYKYYFNNTYIDVLMKNKILTSFVPSPGNTFTRNVKNKRNEHPKFIKKTTNLIPVNESKAIILIDKTGKRLSRGKRWIKHSTKSSNVKHIGNDFNVASKKEGLKSIPNKSNVSLERQIGKKTKKSEKDPFLTMATSFCQEVGQNENDQMLHWCIEKALRRLRFVDMKVPQSIMNAKTIKIENEATPVHATVNRKDLKIMEMSTFSGEISSTTTSVGIPEYTINAPTSTVQDTPDTAMFFPDNDQLESNLKQYELKPDTEGTVYYDGSIHASQIGGPDSDGISDLIPGQDSDSRIDIDPVALDLQEKRRAYVRRINEDIMRQMG